MVTALTRLGNSGGTYACRLAIMLRSLLCGFASDKLLTHMQQWNQSAEARN
jgi:hypothetical protein